MKKFILFLLTLQFAGTMTAQPLTAGIKHTIIIDTDCAIDDLRSISILLARPEITIKGIMASDGSLPPAEGAEKISALLHEFERDDIIIACGDNLHGINPPWRDFNRQISWGDGTGGKKAKPDAVDYLADVLKKTNEKLIIVSLGPLTNIAKLIKRDPASLSGIERIIWYNDSAKPLNGFNYECDMEAAEIVFKSGVRTDVISNLDKEEALLDRDFQETCRKSGTELGSVLFRVHSQKVVQEKLLQNHFMLCDDLAALYLTNPELFEISLLDENIHVRFSRDYDVHGVKEAYRDMINGIYVAERSIVFNRFPAQREMFNYDVRRIMDSAIARFGPDEWKANVMTDEFHGHLGVFSIVGAKMGIRAREYFGVGPDKLEVTTYAGSKPPYSCLNDGLQVSTGATLGMGTIRLAKTKKPEPSAVFKYNGQSIRITLKKDYLEKVEADIDEGISKYGLMDDGYWKLIRFNALKYWLEWDRDEIFDIQEVVLKK